MWIIIFYSWIIGYTTYISYTAISFYQSIRLQREYDLLLGQYEGIEAPLLNQEPQGLTPLNISRITVEEFPSEEEFVCSICLDKFQKGEKIRITPCQHKFHLPCIDNWLMRKGSCPNCLRKFDRSV